MIPRCHQPDFTLGVVCGAEVDYVGCFAKFQNMLPFDASSALEATDNTEFVSRKAEFKFLHDVDDASGVRLAQCASVCKAQRFQYMALQAEHLCACGRRLDLDDQIADHDCMADHAAAQLGSLCGMGTAVGCENVHGLYSLVPGASVSDLGVPSSTLTILSGTVAFLLVLRTNEAAKRWWAGRDVFG